MTQFVQGEDREQNPFAPWRWDDRISKDNPVRVVDVFVAALDLDELGFQGMQPRATGRPPYHPSILLKIYLYGYLNRIQSSRRLEREAQRNIEVMWLTGRLMPDFKTIADFRKDNGPAIRNVCQQFTALCRRLGLFSEAVVAVDGSKFKAVNNRDRNFTGAKVQKRIEQITASLTRSQSALDLADLTDTAAAQAKAAQLREKIAVLDKRMQHLKAIETLVQAAPDKQISLTDPDARSMATSGKGTGIVGYNVQTVVDTRHHLIVAHDVTNVGNDREQLAVMAQQAQTAMDCQNLDVLADKGYFKGEQILACQDAGMTPFVPRPATSASKAEGRFDKHDFVYLAEENAYRCPAGEQLSWRYASIEDGMTLHVYWADICQDCRLKAQCTTGPQRRIKRWEHQAVLETMQQRLDQAPDAMAVRRQTVEHPFGTIKAWMGATHFLTRTLRRVSTEMSLHVLAYNLKRVMQVLGAKPLMAAMRA
jgi:transposase